MAPMMERMSVFAAMAEAAYEEYESTMYEFAEIYTMIKAKPNRNPATQTPIQCTQAYAPVNAKMNRATGNKLQDVDSEKWDTKRFKETHVHGTQ